MSVISWVLKRVKIADLVDYYRNPRSLTQEQFRQLKTSLDKFGLIDKPIVNSDLTVIGGHQRLQVLRDEGQAEVEAWFPDRLLSKDEVSELNIRLNKNTGGWDFDILANQWEQDNLLTWGFSEYELGINAPTDPRSEWKGMPEFAQEDKTAYRTLLVHFDDEEAVRRFAELVEQVISKEAKYIWFPKHERVFGLKYQDES